MSGFLSSILPAFWRGVPFHVRGGELRQGRRPAVHEYFGRDDVWVEDTGRAARVIRLRGFLEGDEVYLQRSLFAAACELRGPGLLIHPSLGAITCSLAEPAGMSDDYEHRRIVELDLSFIQGGQQLFPSLLLNTQNAVLIAAAGAVTALVADLGEAVANVQAQNNAVTGAATRAVTDWGTIATQPLTDAAVIAGETSGLVGNYGRYSGGNLSTGQNASATVASQQAAVVAARTATQTAVAVAVAAAPGAIGDPATLSTALQGVAESLRNVVISPADQIRVLGQLAGYTPAGTITTAPIGASILTLRNAVAANCRRQALIAMAEAAQGFQPTSYDDALAVLRAVCEALDAEILVAADSGDDASYAALRDLRTAVVTDLTERGAQLSRLRDYQFAAPMPALALAYRLYGDTPRADELITRADPIHPAFMPIGFTALSS